MKNFKLTLLSLFAISLVMYSCTDDDDDSVPTGGNTVTPNEEEVITTVGVIIKDQNSVALDTFFFKDADGPGGNDAMIDTLYLPSDTTFKVELYFLDESDPNDVEDITAEILAEDEEHFICFEEQGSSLISVTYNDQDDNQLPLGLDTDWTTSNGPQGVIRITLRHQDGGVKDGTCTPGDSDVEVDFPFVL